MSMRRSRTPRSRLSGPSPGSDEQFRLLVQGVADYAIFMLDRTGHITTWNFGAERIKGYAAEEIIGRHFSTFYTDEDRALGMPARMLARATEEGRAEAEGWRVRKDGTRFWANVVIDAIRGPTGQIIGFAKITRDLSERKGAQEALEEARAAFAQAQKMEAIGQLTGGVAHDFNNLLTVISSNAQLLAQPDLAEHQKRKLLDGIVRAAERGARLTQQLLAFARRQPLTPRTHSIRALVGNFEAVLRRGAGDVARVEFDLCQDPDFARIDGSQFEAALLNLVVNARDATAAGGIIRVRSRVERIDATRAATVPGMKPGEYVVVSVQDDGIGMTPETLARAFEPFYTTKEPGKGTGLGLSQVYGFVTQSGGHVALDSSPGRGTTVALYLPADSEAQERAMSGEAQRRTSRSAMVLLVEDDPDVLQSAITMVQSLGYRTLTASDGLSALEMLRREPEIDVLFTDIVMPKGLNGIDLARQAQELRPTLKILLASGYPLSSFSRDDDLTDEFAFLSKPYRWAELSERLRGLVADVPRTGKGAVANAGKPGRRRER